MDKQCVVCKNMYLAKRATSKFCSATCRVKYSRDVKTEIIPKPKQVIEKHIPQTQEEIEEHYTLKNYPLNKYYSVNGGGSGSYSPYPKTDPRSKSFGLI